MTNDWQPSSQPDEASPNIRAYLHSADAGRSARRGGQATVRFEEREGQTVALRTASQMQPQVSSSVLAGRAQGHDDVPAAWDHPHLVKILDSVQDEGADERALVLEAVPGGSVADLVEARGPLPLGEAVTLLVPVAQALEHLHEHGALHGDVSPQNIMFRSDGAPVVIDPGNARVLGAATADSGTEGFAAEDAYPDQRSDVRGWGALAWFVLTGTPPPPQAQRIPLPLTVAGISPDVARLIEQCLETAPEQRPKSSELSDVLLEHHTPVPLDAYPAVGDEGRALMLTQRPAPRRSLWPWRNRLRAPVMHMPRTLAGSLALALSILAIGGLGATIIILNKPVPATAVKQSSAGSPQQSAAPPATKGAGAGPGRRVGVSHQEVSTSKQAGQKARQSLTRKGVVRSLVKRIEALEQRDPTLLSRVYVPKSAALNADTQLIEKLRSTGHRFEGLSLSVTSLELSRKSKASTRVEATASLRISEHRVVDGSGAVTSTYPARTDRLKLVFKRGDRGWRIRSIRSAATNSSGL